MKRNRLEWLILIASVATIFALVIYLGIQALIGSTPAEIRVEPQAQEARTTETGWLLPVTVRNVGGEAAMSLLIEARATVGGGEETSDLSVNLLAGGSWRNLVVGFSGPPDGEVSFRVVGYESP